MPSVRPGVLADDRYVAECFRNMWLDNQVAAKHVVPDSDQRVLDFLTLGREHLELQTFIAETPSGPCGAAVAQLFAGLYPDVLSPELRKYGYIWGVYVSSEERRQGVGQALTQACVTALRQIGCTHALLHAAPMGRNVYEGLGFEATNELKLEL